jgi:dienelactone hydrolase
MFVDRRTAIGTLAGATVGGLLNLNPNLDAEPSLRLGLCGSTDLKGFKSYCFIDSAGVQHQVYVTEGGGPPVILLHELPGLVDDDVKAARRVADLGYTVVAPLFFGKPGRKARRVTTILNTLRVCDGKEFACGDGEKTSPHATWLRELAAAVKEEWSAGQGVGVIGMCLTGALPLAMLQERAVAAAVLCQPTLPFNLFSRFGWFTDENALGLDPRDLEQAKTASTAPILGIRYTGDFRCPPQKFKRLVREFGDRFFRIDMVGNHHSTLASGFCPQAFDEVTSFLNRYVRATPQAGTGDFPRLAKSGSLDEVRIENTCPATHHA